MKIKTVKKMNILELAQAVRDGEVDRGAYTSFRNGDEVYFGSEVLEFRNVGDNTVRFSDYFEVEVLEELTEDTELPCDVVIVSTTSGIVNSFIAGKSISVLKGKHIGSCLYYVYQQHSDGSIGKLIWSKENGFEDGVLEVSE